MVNGFFMIRTMSYVIASFFPILMFICVLVLVHDIILASVAAVVTALFAAILGRVISGSPFIWMLEGSGILTLFLNSSGIATPYLTKTDSRNLTLETKKGIFTSIYDRTIGFYLKTPQKATLQHDKEKDEMVIHLPNKEFTKNYFQLMDKPMLIYNEKAGTFLSKQALCELENKVLTEYLSLVTIAKIDALGLPLTELTKTVSEQFKPQSLLRMLDNPIIKIILICVIVALIGFLVVQFGPQLMQSIQGTAGQAIASPTGKPITPIG